MARLDQLQLRPHERRLLVFGAAILFVLLNLWFVWPHYGELANVRAQISRSERTLSDYQRELNRTNEYLAQLTELQKENVGVLDQDLDLTLLNMVQAQMGETGVSHGGIVTARGGTNQFFEQKALQIELSPTPPEPLIRFLVALATNQVVLRVKELDLRPDPTKTKLTGKIRVVASFQRESLSSTPAPAQTPPRI